MDTKRREPFHRAHRSFFVGLFVLVPLVVIPVFLAATLVKMEFFADWQTFHVQYDNCYGLSKGNKVTMSGIRVGYIDRVVLTPEGQAAVTIKVLEDHSHLVRKNTHAVLMQSNMVTGDWEVSLSGGDMTVPAAADGDSLSPELPLRIDKVVEEVTVMAESFQSILKEIADGGGLVGYLLKEDTLIYALHDLLNGAQGFLGRANHVLQDAGTALQSFDELGHDGSVFLDTLTDIVVRIGPVVDDMNVVVGKVDGVTDDFSGVVSKVKGELDSLSGIIEGIESHWLLRRSIQRQKEKAAD